MSRLGRTVLLSLALLLGGAPAASASSEQDFPVGGAEFERARDIAQAHWGAVPCQGKVMYSWQGLEPLTNARATWSNPTDAWNNPGANFDCSVVFNELTRYDFAMLCTVMAHELGHLLGHAHAGEDGQLMSSVYSAPLPECGGPATAAGEDDHADDGDPIAWSVTESRARKKKRAEKSSRKSTGRRRCVVRFKAGERAQRCVTLSKHGKRKARTAGIRRRVHRHAARETRTGRTFDRARPGVQAVAHRDERGA